ncbi:DnaJ P58IPK-like protein B [Cardamine amara subsp. amara]|uniref:DnaJ P58IPK-like protein B n=1 Tax=Cardamine amara subsp. amara TaxID=228776 RepID=A0ABD1BT54_CARAN
MGGEDGERDKDKKRNPLPPPQKADLKLWGILAFTVIGATATTFAVARSQSVRTGTRGGSFRTAFQEESWRRYNKRMQEEYEDEMERVERIRRMQSVFNRERNKFRRGYENWKENDPSAQQYHQQFQRHDWYWKTESSHRNQRTNYQESSDQRRVYPLSHHYSVLGLSRSRAAPYTEAEIKKAFREKAMEFHPDQNQDNKIVAEAKFKEVLLSYEAIKQERKDM